MGKCTHKRQMETIEHLGLAGDVSGGGRIDDDVAAVILHHSDRSDKGESTGAERIQTAFYERRHERRLRLAVGRHLVKAKIEVLRFRLTQR